MRPTDGEIPPVAAAGTRATVERTGWSGWVDDTGPRSATGADRRYRRREDEAADER